MKYKIGNLKLENRIFLAPMLEINDIAFRILCKKAGASLVYTGMINPLTEQKLDFSDKPAIQIFTTNTKGLVEFIKKHEANASLFDFNLGCPAKTAKKLGFGCFFHNNLDEIENILKVMRETTEKPITVKLRKSNNALKIAKMASKYCDAICIHPRTQIQGYSGEPDLDFALKIKKAVKIPVIYSGNVNEDNAEEFLEKYGFDFVMIGRASVGNPTIFSKLTGTEDKNKVNFGDYYLLAREHGLYFSQVKFQAMKFTKGIYNSTEVRFELVKAKTLKQVIEIMKKNGLMN